MPIGEVLRRRGLTVQRRPRQRATIASTQPFADVTGPNATWCVDFKGHFRMQDGNRCHPLTIIDAYSRYLLRCEGVENPDGREVERVFDSAFQAFGLPSAIRSDNGPPFASAGAGGLTKLSVWWLRLGIRVERIAPGKPQQDGRQERFHRTLKTETAKPPHAHLRARQRAFDVFRREYDEEPTRGARAAPALQHLRPIASPISASPLRFEIHAWNEAARGDGFIRWRNKRLFISSALAREDVELRYEPAIERWHIVFGPFLHRLDRRNENTHFHGHEGPHG